MTLSVLVRPANYRRPSLNPVETLVRLMTWTASAIGLRSTPIAPSLLNPLLYWRSVRKIKYVWDFGDGRSVVPTWEDVLTSWRQCSHRSSTDIWTSVKCHPASPWFQSPRGSKSQDEMTTGLLPWHLLVMESFERLVLSHLKDITD